MLFEEKIKLRNNIQSIKNKKVLLQIYDILKNENTKFTYNKYGIFVLFQNLQNETYEKLLAIVNDYKMKNIKQVSFNKLPIIYDEINVDKLTKLEKYIIDIKDKKLFV